MEGVSRILCDAPPTLVAGFYEGGLSHLAHAQAERKKFRESIQILNTMQQQQLSISHRAFTLLIPALGEDREGLAWCLKHFKSINKTHSASHQIQSRYRRPQSLKNLDRFKQISQPSTAELPRNGFM